MSKRNTDAVSHMKPGDPVEVLKVEQYFDGGGRVLRDVWVPAMVVSAWEGISLSVVYPEGGREILPWQGHKWRRPYRKGLE